VRWRLVSCRAVTGRTRVVALTWVHSSTGVKSGAFLFNQPDGASLTRRRLRSSAAPGDLASAKLLGLRVGHVEFANALARIVKRDADRGSFAVRDFRARHVAH